MNPGGDAAETITRGFCPDCGGRGFVLGPRGGAAINIECANLHCRARWNVSPWAGVMAFAHRIPRRAEGGQQWPSCPETLDEAVERIANNNRTEGEDGDGDGGGRDPPA